MSSFLVKKEFGQITNFDNKDKRAKKEFYPEKKARSEAILSLNLNFELFQQQPD
jgi:hypothetical protein